MSVIGFEVDRAGFAVDSRTLLEPVSITLRRGLVYGIVGQNGSGKTTLVRLLARRHRPSFGSIAFEGVPLECWRGRSFARKVAYLPQQPAVAEALTARELAALGRYPWHGSLGRFTANDAAYVDEALSLADVAQLADRLIETLSGGERQRVWIAMMLAQQSEFLILDEPTESLDLAHQVELMRLIRGLAADRKLGIVLVLHDINLAAMYCDEIVALRDGRMLTRGTPSALMHGDTLEAIYGVKMGIVAHPISGAPMGYVR